MVSVLSNKRQWGLGLLLLAVLISNVLIYRLPAIPLPTDSNGVVLGSLLDLAIVAPLLVLAITRKKGFTLKRFITFMVLGMVAARFIIPAPHLAPFKFVPYFAIGIEMIILLAEIGLIFLLIKHLPTIFRELKKEPSNHLFAFPALVKTKVSNNPLISIIAAESLMFYYAFASWRKKPIDDNPSTFYLHRKTSLIAFYVMMIHAIVMETIGFHWWLHDKSMIVSIVLLILNVYSIVYFIGDIQAIRLNPTTIGDDKMRISLGLGKRMEIDYDNIAEIHWGETAAAWNLKEKELISFIARDFEESVPQCVITFEKPQKATLFLGFEKEFTKAAIRVDDPERFRQELMQKIAEQ